MEPAEVLGIEHVDLTVNDLKRSAEFYDRVLGALGFRRLDEDDAGEHDIRWGKAHLTIAIRAATRENAGAIYDRYRVGLHHLAFKVRSREQVDGRTNLRQFTLVERSYQIPQFESLFNIMRHNDNCLTHLTLYTQ